MCQPGLYPSQPVCYPLPLSTRVQRSALSEQQLREEVASLQQQGHRRLLVLTGEHPRYTFDEFLKAIDTISSGGQPSQRLFPRPSGHH